MESPLLDNLPVLKFPPMSGLDCLNLSLSIPKKSVEDPKQKTSVLVFIHDGAFVGGSNSVQLSGHEVYNGANLVQHSIRNRQDIIVVRINYRVGTS